jgi:hypothetical protein
VHCQLCLLSEAKQISQRLSSGKSAVPSLQNRKLMRYPVILQDTATASQYELVTALLSISNLTSTESLWMVFTCTTSMASQ